jgi:hypothetical protein
VTDIARGGTPPARLGFPGPGEFVGSYDARIADMENGGQSTYDGSIVVTLVDRDLVEQALPGDFRLARPTPDRNTHPVIHLLGHQRDLKLIEGGIPRPADADDYQEMILLVPFVVHGSGAKWHSFVVRMYLDSTAPIIIGDAIFAYAKLPATFDERGSPDDMTTRTLLLLQPVFQGTVKVTGAWRSSDEACKTLAQWSDLRKIFAMPIVGADVVAGRIVRTVCSYWEWHHAGAEVAPATSQHRFIQPFREGMEGWPQGPVVSGPNGAFVIRGLRWRLAKHPPVCAF